jgi:hypothetical protein
LFSEPVATATGVDEMVAVGVIVTLAEAGSIPVSVLVATVKLVAAIVPAASGFVKPSMVTDVTVDTATAQVPPLFASVRVAAEPAVTSVALQSEKLLFRVSVAPVAGKVNPAGNVTVIVPAAASAVVGVKATVQFTPLEAAAAYEVDVKETFETDVAADATPSPTSATAPRQVMPARAATPHRRSALNLFIRPPWAL